MSLDWGPSPSLVDGYVVYRSVQAGGPYSRLSLATVLLTSYTDTDVTAGQTYFYVVTAIAAGVESAHSNEVVATVPAP